MNSAAPKVVVSALIEAFAARDFERARGYLSDDEFSYISPIETVNDADAFIINISRVGPILERIEIENTFVNDDMVCSVLNVFTTMDELDGTRSVMLTTVRDGKVTRLESIFDATAYNKMIVVSREHP